MKGYDRMKITLVHGQNHKGSTYQLSHILLDKIGQKQDVEIVNEFFLPKDLNHFCLGCFQCIEGDENCPFFDEKTKILDAIEAADVLIFTTPTYCLRASAPMKSFLDMTFTRWMVHRPKAIMFSKKAIVLSSSAGSGGKLATKDIATSLFYWGIPWIKQYSKSLQAMNWKGVSKKNQDKVDRDLTKLSKKILRKKNTKAGIKTKFMFHMMKNMQKAGWGSSPYEKQYWMSQGWFGGKAPWR